MGEQRFSAISAGLARTLDVSRMLAELRQEKAAIEQAILSLEELTGAHRRGRPPGSERDKGGMPPSGGVPPHNGMPPAAAAIDPGPFRNRSERAPAEKKTSELEIGRKAS